MRRCFVVFTALPFALLIGRPAFAQPASGAAARLSDLVAVLDAANPEVAAAQREIDSGF